MPSEMLHATSHATSHPRSKVRGIRHPHGGPAASGHRQIRSVAPHAHLNDMSNHTIATPITTWAELRASDREVLNRAEVAALLTLDPRTVDHAIEDGTLPAVHIGRRVLIPRRPFLQALGVDGEAPA
jgi:excisionase family DNA binding protein